MRHGLNWFALTVGLNVGLVMVDAAAAFEQCFHVQCKKLAPEDMTVNNTLP
jgi:hypothetical protein